MATSKPFALFANGEQFANATGIELKFMSNDTQTATSGGTVTSEGRNKSTINLDMIESIQKTGVTAVDILRKLISKEEMTIVASPVATNGITSIYKCAEVTLKSDPESGKLTGSFVFNSVDENPTIT